MPVSLPKLEEEDPSKALKPQHSWLWLLKTWPAEGLCLAVLFVLTPMKAFLHWSAVSKFPSIALKIFLLLNSLTSRENKPYPDP